MKISLCMIVRDEEAVLARCLESVKGLFDEIVIADTGSKDRTVEIAKKYTDNVYFFPWCDDFSAARNFAFSKATGEYSLWLDADDFVPEESGKALGELRRLLEAKAPDLVMCPLSVEFDYAKRPVSTFYRERFFKCAANFVWRGRVHECIAPRGKTVRFPDFCVWHLGSEKERGGRNLSLYQKWSAAEPLSPRDLFYYGRELYYHKLYPEAIAILSEMISSEAGWYVNKIEACRTLGKCFAARGDTDRALEAYFRSFTFGEPRAFVCCEIARLLREKNRLREAAFWFEAALSCKDHTAEGDFEDAASRGIAPLLELVCLYFRMGDDARARFYHQKTEELDPNHPSVIYNRNFFQSVPTRPSSSS